MANTEENEQSAASIKRMPWNNTAFRKAYSGLSDEALKTLPVPKVPSQLTDTENLVNKYSSDIISALHKAATSALQHIPGRNTNKKVQKHWWNLNCNQAKDRHKFWLTIWNDCNRPRTGAVYDAYKSAKYNFRKACRHAVSSASKANFHMCDTLMRNNRSSAFWKHIKRGKGTGQSNMKNIPISDLDKYFRTKFQYDACNENTCVKSARAQVNEKLVHLKDVPTPVVVTDSQLKLCIRKLRKGSACGKDGVLAKHLVYTDSINLRLHLCHLFSMCFTFGTVPETFKHGILVPILKKSTLDPSIAKNYRPVILSTVFSKLIEMFVLDMARDVCFSNSQFGFISGRGTSQAISLAHDVSAYCSYWGTPVFMCGLDAQGAFDEIPHPILFQKALSALPDHCWRLMCSWYKDLSV